MHNNKLTQAMLFAAGLGTRLAPITNDRPKALAEVNGQPLIFHVLKKLENEGIERVVINTHHFAERLENWIREQKFNMEIIISHEEELLDTGGGLAKAAEYFTDGDILLYNVDVLSNINIQKMNSFHQESNSLVTLAVRKRETTRYFLFNKKQKLIGWKNTKTKVTIFTTDSTKNYNELAFSGIHIVKHEFLKLLGHPEKFSLTPFYLELAKTHTLSAYQHDEDYWFDCGKIETLKAAEKFLNK
jgi:MurNAc alpha-1-phosphate uridylyltransferase